MKRTLLFLWPVLALLIAIPMIATAAPVADGGSDWIGKVVGMVIIAGIAFFAYTRWKKSQAKKASRPGSTTVKPPSG